MIENIYPFCGIVGQADMKKALVLNIINPQLGGVLIRGEKGTAKSTSVRALANVLENIEVVNLPVSATEDRVVGTLDVEHAIKHGEKKFEPGILMKAHNNILYIDEVNLLDDHVVDVLLDAAAMGVNIVEREGVSYSHPSEFVLVGTMNPEEGDLRPQLIDRFGLVVDVYGESDLEKRIEVMERRLAYDLDPQAFIESYEKESKNLLNQILSARNLLKYVDYSKACLELIAKISIYMGVDGHRADITLIKTAMTHAAYKGRKIVTKEDLFEAARLALPHRMRKRPFEDGEIDFEYIFTMIEDSSL